MKKGVVAGLLLGSLFLTGCGESIEQRQYKAVNVAKDFNMAILDYQHRTSEDDIRGLELATEAAQAMVKQQLMTPEEVARIKGDKEMPEVVNVVITDTNPLGQDGEEGFIVNTYISYYPGVYRYAEKVGLRVIPTPSGEWKVDSVNIGGEL